jgi:hypothetical protein
VIERNTVPAIACPGREYESFGYSASGRFGTRAIYTKRPGAGSSLRIIPGEKRS